MVAYFDYVKRIYINHTKINYAKKSTYYGEAKTKT